MNLFNIILFSIMMQTIIGAEVNRESYVIDVPPGCTVDPKDADIDLDHMTCINLSDSSSMTISVIDSAKKGTDICDKTYQNIIKSFKSVEKGNLIEVKGLKPGHVKSAAGLFNGLKFNVHIFTYSKDVDNTKEKTVVITCLILGSESEKCKSIIDGITGSLKVK